MGQYKVPQNVESADKIIGPLTLKQFIYAVMGVAWGGLSFAALRTVPAVMIIVGAPPTILLLLLAFYTRDGQNFEQLLIAMVGYFANSRKRIWIKEEIAEAFRIEPPKPVIEQSQRDPAEVRGQLEKLGNLIDSRGWNKAPEPDAETILPATPQTDRLVAPPVSAPQAGDLETPKSDILDLKGSPLAVNLEQLLNSAAADVREEAIEQMQTKPKKAAHPAAEVSTSVTTPAPGDILKLATERDDLTVAQLAASATRSQDLQPGQSVDLR